MSLKDRFAAMSEPQGVRGLRLRRPLAVLDLETTGTDPSSGRIVVEYDLVGHGRFLLLVSKP